MTPLETPKTPFPTGSPRQLSIGGAIACAIELEADQLRGVHHQAWLALSVLCVLASWMVGTFSSGAA